MEIFVLVAIGVGIWWYFGHRSRTRDQEYFDHRLATYGVNPDLIPKNGRVQITAAIRDHVRYGRKHGVYEKNASMGGMRYEHWFLDDAAKLTAFILSPDQAKVDITSDESKWNSLKSTASWLLPILDGNAVSYVFEPPWGKDNDAP